MRIESEVAGFDAPVDGGHPENPLHAICGRPGGGKTTSRSQFVANGARRREKALFVSLYETKVAVRENVAGYEVGFDRLLGIGEATSLVH